MTFEKHELLSEYAILETYLNVIGKMEITSVVKRHIFHLRLTILGRQIVYYQQRQIFMSTLTGIFLLFYFILSLQNKHNQFWFFSAEFMAAFHPWGSIKQVGYVNESGPIL